MLVVGPNSTCDICAESFMEAPAGIPHTIPCGHIFCGPCLSQMPPQCPICRRQFSCTDIHPLHVDSDPTPSSKTPSPQVDALAQRFFEDVAAVAGVSDVQSQILIEMELAEFAIQIYCRECRRPAFVDREDYSEVCNIVCPQDGCNHIWCKKCEQTIVLDGPKHSCDGSSELDYLMKEGGWKHCPNCTTPIQRDSGCNHMTCISPGCNTHFCYVCGGMIVRSALDQEIEQSLWAHFRKCQLFEVPE